MNEPNNMNLEQLKTELREFIELSKKAAPSPWKPSPNNLIGGWWVQTPFNEVAETSTADFCNEVDATFIACSRNISPAMAECLLVAIERLNDMPFDLADALETQILNIWEASK